MLDQLAREDEQKAQIVKLRFFVGMKHREIAGLLEIDYQTQAKDLFARAHELDEEAREAFLAEACGDDAELRLEVQRLLVTSQRADSFFGDSEAPTVASEHLDSEAPTIASGDFVAPTLNEAAGDEIGPYTLRQQIGEGGFGTAKEPEKR